MKAFTYTSAWIALVDANDINHPLASHLWKLLISHGWSIFTTNYVLVETIAILQRRYGMSVVATFLQGLAPVQIGWISQELHTRGLNRFLHEHRRRLSLVDCTSFEFMLHEGIDFAYAFDDHFREFGFQLIREHNIHANNPPSSGGGL